MEIMMTSVSATETSHKDQRDNKKLQALQEAITQGFASGKAKNVDIQAIKQRAKKQVGLTL